MVIRCLPPLHCALLLPCLSHMYIHTHTGTHAHIHTHTYTRTHTHAQAHIVMTEREEVRGDMMCDAMMVAGTLSDIVKVCVRLLSA